MPSLDRDAVLAAIPTSWLDPILTGRTKVLPEGYEYSPKDIERVLRAIKGRLEELPVVETKKRK